MIPWYQARYAVKGTWAAVVALLVLTSVAVAVAMTVQLHGFKVWPINIEGALAKNSRLEGVVAAMTKASEDARLAQQKLNNERKGQYDDLAERIDENAELQADAVRDATERFIAANRVRPQATGSRPCAASPATLGDGARGGEEVRGASVVDAGEAVRVAVTDRDVRVCTANTLQAESARAWALGLEKTDVDTE